MNANPRLSFLYIVLCFAALLCIASAQAQGPTATRDLVLTNWKADHFALPPGMSIHPYAGETPDGEPLTKIVLAPGEWDQQALTDVNIPVSATGQPLTCYLHKEGYGAGVYKALFQEQAHGWGLAGSTHWALTGDDIYSTPVPDQKGAWDWKLGFFKGTLDPPPYRFRGFLFHSPSSSLAGNQPVVVVVGPVHVRYVPDDTHWLYTDLQPKTIPNWDGALAPLTLRLANLGTQPRSFRLIVRALTRNGLPNAQPPAVLAGLITLQPGELREIPVHLPLSLLGTYHLHYEAQGDSAATAEDTVSVVNAYDSAAAFRDWAAHRRWFSVPLRRPKPSDKPHPGQIALPTANNGLSDVPIFPVQPRTNIGIRALPGDLSAITGAPLTVLNTQLSPAWVVQSHAAQITLFGGMTAQGEGGPTHLAFATAHGSRILLPGTKLDAASLRGMTQPWLLAWWQGSAGWSGWDVPYLITLQHRPTSLTYTPEGVKLTFAGPAGSLAAMPLFGYAKLPQKTAWMTRPTAFRHPTSWPTAWWASWTWEPSLPTSVAQRCDWWARALTRVPYAVTETYTIDHAQGTVDVKDTFRYFAITDDWHTQPLYLAPLSPSVALVRLNGFPVTVEGTLTDCAYPTIFGPYSAIENAQLVRYQMSLGQFWMQTGNPDLTPPPDSGTPAHWAQSLLLGRGVQTDDDALNQLVDWPDGNFVLKAQEEDDRTPAFLNEYVTGTLRRDAKGWLQGRMLHTLLSPTQYDMDEREGIRRYLDGPGIGNFGAGDWGDSGKLGTDMIYDAWVYAYATGDYQTIADRWNVICSLNSLPTTQAWATDGRAEISEMGDEAQTQLALARLAYAIGDRETYAAAVYWWSRELVEEVTKQGALTKWRAQWMPWNSPGVDLPTVTGTNLYGTNAGWVDGGLNHPQDDGQWLQLYTRLDDPDSLRFLRRYGRELPTREVAAATKQDYAGNEALYYARANVLGLDPQAAQQDFTQGDPKTNPPNDDIDLVAASWHDYPPQMETLIPPTEPSISDSTGFAWSQMNNAQYGLVSPQNAASGKPPTAQWYWWNSPRATTGMEAGDKWTFGSIGPTGEAVAAITAQPVSTVSTLYAYQF